jgi:hypothetical protein
MSTTHLPVDAPPLSFVRLAGLRGAYLLLGLGLAIAKWPLLSQGHTMPLYEGVTLCFLTALSVLALLGLRFPVMLLPVLLFEIMWKVLWLSIIVLPQAVEGSLDPDTRSVAYSCALVVPVAIAVPWRYVVSRLRQGLS